MGKDEKCLSCNNDKKNECSSCNIGHTLLNGKCQIDYSFKAEYYLPNDENTYIELSNGGYIRYIDKIIVDGENINPSSNYYNFKSKGPHTVYFYMKKDTLLSSLEYMFYNIKFLTNIFFRKILSQKM